MSPLLALAACGAPADPPDPPPEGPSAPAPGDVSPWAYDGSDGEPPPVDVVALGAALDLAVRSILAQDARGIVDAYLDVWATSATPACPGVTDDGLGNLYWADGCEAPDGTWFGGYLSHYTLDGAFDDESGMYLTGTQLGGNVGLAGPAGIVDLEGSAAYVTGISPDGTTELVVSVLIGGFYAPETGGWLGEPRAVTTSLTGYAIPSIGGVLVVVDGAIGVEVDGAPYSVLFRADQLANAALGSICEDEPGGTVEIRDPYGRWIDVAFHGPIVDGDPGDPARCDGCGDATLDGAPIDPVCADFGPWFRWESLP